MEIFSIPLEADSYLVYRPLKRLAFVANRPLLNCIFDYFRHGKKKTTSTSEAAWQFLDSVGFFEEDPTPPGPDRTDKPTVAVLCLTSKCNLRCVYCYADGGEREARVLDPRQAVAVIDRVEKNCREVAPTISFHGGGEPTQEWDLLVDLTEYVRNRRREAIISLTSNGCWTPQQSDWIVKNISEVSLSFDGLPAVHDSQRPTAGGGPSSPLVIRNIHQMDRHGLPYGIRLTVTDQTISRLAEGVEWLCENTRCPRFQVEPAFAHGRAARNRKDVTEHARFIEAFLAAYDLAAGYGRELYYSGARPSTLSATFCQAADRALVLRPDGAITACYEVCDELHPLNDLFRIGHVQELSLVDSDPAGELRSRLKHRRELCRDCFLFWHCAGDCPSKVLGPEPDAHLHFGPRCTANREITRELLLRYIQEGGGVWRG